MSIKAMKQALDVLENTARSAVEQYVAEQKAITVLRQAIEQAERQEPDLPPVEIGVDVTEHGTTVVAFYRRPNAVMEMFYSQFHPQPKQPKNPSIRIQNHTHTNHPMRHWDRTCPACVADSESIANPIANHSETSGSPMPVAKYDSIELHVLHSHLAGMLFDFIGWLTSRRTRLCLSDSDNARPAVDAIVDFAKMRGLRLEDAQVKDWQAILTTPAQSQAEKQEPVAWVESLEKPQPRCVTNLKYRSVAEVDAGVQFIPLYTARGIYKKICAQTRRTERNACHQIVWDYGFSRIDNEEVQAACVNLARAIQARGKNE